MMVSCCDAPGLMPIEQALEKIQQVMVPVSETEMVPVHKLAGRIMAEDIISPIDVPGYDNSAMDGYALRHADLASVTVFTQIGKSFAGSPFNGRVEAGQCVRIMTGAQIPEGADTVVMQENVHDDNGQISLLSAVKPGEAIRRRGEDIGKGQVVLSKGHRISPVDIGLLTSVGISEVRVFRQITVALFSTGDELRQPGEALPDGCIYDSNRPALYALLNELGAKVLDLGVVEDNPDSIRDAFLKADKEADVVITSGGVSVGEADFTRDILEELGEIDFWKLAMKPGKPLAFGRLPNSYFFGLPGNPVSAMVTFHQIALPNLLRLGGNEPAPRFRIQARAAAPFKKRPGRTDFQRGIWERDNQNGLQVSPLSNQSSGVLSSISQANCYIVLEQERGSVEAGEMVTIEPFDSYLKAN